MDLNVAISPCPNDIFTFFGWMNEKIPQAPKAEFSLHDIETLNQNVLSKQAQISKVSFLTFAQAMSDYYLLPVGAAFGYGYGPKLVANVPNLTITNLTELPLLVPGKNTVAYLLARFLLPEPKRTEFCRFDEVVPRLKCPEPQAGIIIHESRFNLEAHGLFEVADLGQCWLDKTASPLPLGCLVARRILPKSMISAVCEAVRGSLAYARENLSSVSDALVRYSQESDLSSALQHVDLYVNADTLQISPSSLKGIEILLNEAKRNQLIADTEAKWLFD